MSKNDKKVMAIAAFMLLISFIGMFVISVIGFSNTDTSSKPEVQRIVTTAIESAYFEGQKDALEGDVRIIKSEFDGYKWIKSPWDDGKTPLFTPQTKKEKN